MEKLTGGTLTPAYGRDYKNRQQVVDSLNRREDFTINYYNAQGYCSIRDLEGSFQVRDRSMRKVWTVSIKQGVAK